MKRETRCAENARRGDWRERRPRERAESRKPTTTEMGDGDGDGDEGDGDDRRTDKPRADKRIRRENPKETAVKKKEGSPRKFTTTAEPNDTGRSP